MTKLGQRVTVNRNGRREREIDPSGISFRRVFTYATRFSTYFHSRRYQTPSAAVVKNDRSKSDWLYFVEKWNFILFPRILSRMHFLSSSQRNPAILVTATNSTGHIFTDEFYRWKKYVGLTQYWSLYVIKFCLIVKCSRAYIDSILYIINTFLLISDYGRSFVCLLIALFRISGGLRERFLKSSFRNNA